MSAEKATKNNDDGLPTRIILSMASDIGDMIRTTERIKLQFLAMAKASNVKVVLD